MKFFVIIIFLASIQTSFAQFVNKNDSIVNKNDTINLEALYKELPEVVVKAEKTIVKLEHGKMVYNIQNLLEKIPADNAYDAIKNIPGIIQVGERLKFAGSNITLIINGKPTTFSQEQVIQRLKNMPSAQLNKAELMLAAPAQYHVRGAAINVITKDYISQHQTSGQVQGTLNQSKYFVGYSKGNLLLVNKKLTLDLGYAYTNGKKYAEREHDALHPLNNSHIPYYDKTRTMSTGYSHDFRAELGYHFAPNHTIDISYTGNVTKSDIENKTTGSSISTQNSYGHNYLHNLDISYTLPFGLRLVGSYTYYESPRNQNLIGILEYSERNLIASSKQVINKWQVMADQVHKLGKNWALNYGLKYQKSNNNSYQTTRNASGVILPEATNEVNIDEHVFNSHIGFSKQIGKGMSVNASLAFENFHSPQWDDWHVYPSFNATWMINTRHLLNLSLNSDASYPSYWSTMNQIFYSSSYQEVWGNPMLKPSRKYNTSLMWQINRKYTLVAFANVSPNGMVQLPYQPSDRIAVIMKEVNLNHRNVYGLQAMTQFAVGSWLGGNAFVTGFYSNDKCKNFFDINFNRKKFSVQMGSNATFSFSRKMNLKLVVNPIFQSNAIQGVYDIGNTFTLNASLRWISSNGVWNIIASGNNLTNRKYTTKSTFGNQNFSMRICQDWITGAFSVIYKFGNYKDKQYKSVDISRLRK